MNSTSNESISLLQRWFGAPSFGACKGCWTRFFPQQVLEHVCLFIIQEGMAVLMKLSQTKIPVWTVVSNRYLFGGFITRFRRRRWRIGRSLLFPPRFLWSFLLLGPFLLGLSVSVSGNSLESFTEWVIKLLKSFLSLWWENSRSDWRRLQSVWCWTADRT